MKCKRNVCGKYEDDTMCCNCPDDECEHRCPDWDKECKDRSVEE